MKALHDHPATNRCRVKTGSIAMRFIEAEGKHDKVPKKHSGRDASDDTTALIEILLVGICNLADRCAALEDAAMRDAAASSSTPHDVQPAKKKKTVGASLEFYDLPELDAWPTTAGKCHKCGHKWSHNNRKDIFPVDTQVWKTIMEKMFADWSAEKMSTGQQCRLLDSYIHTAANVAASLASFEIIKEDEIAKVEARLRNRLFQPDVRGDSKALWLYHAGQKDNKYLTFGSVSYTHLTLPTNREV